VYRGKTDVKTNPPEIPIMIDLRIDGIFIGAITAKIIKPIVNAPMDGWSFKNGIDCNNFSICGTMKGATRLAESTAIIAGSVKMSLELLTT